MDNIDEHIILYNREKGRLDKQRYKQKKRLIKYFEKQNTELQYLTNQISKKYTEIKNMRLRINNILNDQIKNDKTPTSINLLYVDIDQ